MERLAGELVERIKSKQNPEKARWLEKYVKHDVRSYGVGIPEIRALVQEFTHRQLAHVSMQEQTELLSILIRNPYTEPKLAAILFVQLYWNSVEPAKKLQCTSDWFDAGAITDWNVCDWLCVRLLTPLLEKKTDLCETEFRKWSQNQSIWKARASLVPFAQVKQITQHQDVIAEFSARLIKREERFCKTAVGWVMREFSKTNSTFVTLFLEEHKQWLTREVIKNATKYMLSN